LLWQEQNHLCVRPVSVGVNKRLVSPTLVAKGSTSYNVRLHTTDHIAIAHQNRHHRALQYLSKMSLKSMYQSYLTNPSAAALNDKASLSYITTLTTINTAALIVKHNAAHQKVLKKKQETVLDSVEGSSAVTLDVETTLEFISGGGAYLPGLDDNFVSDRVVTFPMVSVQSRSHTPL